jgi:LacI family transcriptional regulator
MFLMVGKISYIPLAFLQICGTLIMESFPKRKAYMKTTIKDISAKTGFGVGTISRALNSCPYSVKEETRKEILRVAKKYNYIKDITAQVLVTGKSFDIGLMIPAVFDSVFYNDFFIKLIATLTSCSAQKGYSVRPIIMKKGMELNQFITEARSLKLCGIIISSYCGNYFIDERAIKTFDSPVVILNAYMRDKNIYTINLDNFKGGHDGTSFLISKGYKNICVITAEKNDFCQRLKGYKKAMAGNGLKIKEEFILHGDGSELSGYTVSMKVLNKTRRPDAIFALNDQMAIGAIRAIKESGLKCPSDVSVMGFDGLDIGGYIDPGLTTMLCPVDTIGREAVNILLDSSARTTVRHCKIKATILERQSC